MNSTQVNCKFLEGTPIPGLHEYVWNQLTFQVNDVGKKTLWMYSGAREHGVNATENV